ncbi:hypothetical protein ASD11_00225 [Aeromicrobium sp. Root495]|uniref:class E sortase n=1 Tax=Aeromicrobium sp. Root495 TaxID=1736550 RepID=UPI0006FEBB3D|nr:class E sortase [Aeromicrobium sp. Root495]KQY58137.1 hypothetical protein ASD11_00225 [Aeromicrobium sp. Root495]
MTTADPSTFPPSAPRRRRRFGVRRMIGVLLLLAGLGVLGYGAWQYWGTNIVAKQHHAEEKRLIADAWGQGKDGNAIGLLRVERFGKDYEVPIVRGFSDKALAEGVGWYKKGAKPGQIGNFVIAGHRVTHGEPFRDFLKLRKGDKVVVETRKYVFTYKLRNAGDKITVPFTTSWPLQPVPDPDLRGEPPTEPLLTMLTCSELFHTDNRNVVVGDLLKITDKADPNAEVDPLPAKKEWLGL